MYAIVFDTEATSLVPGQLCQLSYLMVQGEDVRGKNFFFSVDEMDPDAQAVHGMSMEELNTLSGGLYFEDLADEVLADFSAARVLIGHNVKADDDYLRVELTRAGKRLRRVPTFCTMNFAAGLMNLQRKVVTGRPKPPRLEELCEYYGVSAETAADMSGVWFSGGTAAHDARFDAAATLLCLQQASRRGDIRGVL